MKQSLFQRFRSLIWAIVVFLVFDFSALGINFYVGKSLENSAQRVNIAGRQRMLSQRISKAIFAIDSLDAEFRDVKTEELRSTTDLFNSTLQAFYQGGDIVDTTGNNVSLSQVTTAAQMDVVEAALETWSDYYAAIQRYLGAQEEVEQQLALEEATLLSVERNLTLLKLMNDLTVGIEIEAAARASKIRWLQSIGMIIAIVIAGIIIVRSVRAIFATEVELQKANERLSEQMNDLSVAKGKAERANEIKTQFLANMTHELRTPLNGISGVSQVLLSSELTQEQRAHVDNIKRSSNALASLVSDILDYSEIESGAIEIKSEPSAPVEIVEDEARLIFPALANHSNRIYLNIDNTVPASVNIDETRLRQILKILFSNAAKFCSNGEVTVGLSLERSPSQSQLVLYVQDTGVGIARDKLDTVFDKFAQADQTTTRSTGGVGIGLAMMQDLVTLMQGSVEVESELGEGSVFTVRLPVSSPSVDTFVVRYHQELCNQQICVVSDHPSAAQNLIGITELSGANVTHYDALAFNGLEHENRQRFDVVVCDASSLESTIDANKLDSCKAKVFAYYQSRESADNLPSGSDCRVGPPVSPTGLLEMIQDALSVDQGATIEEPTADDKALDFSHLRVLLVDDNEVNLMVAQLLLDEVSITPDVAEDGLQALEAVTAKDYDIVLMDCQMPNMDGYQATQAIRKLDQASKASTVVIAMTANAMTGDREKCLAAGMNDYLSKPVDAQLLYETIAKWTSQ